MSEKGSPEQPSNVEPASESEPTSQAEPTPPPEPIPEWSTATEEWGLAWEFHQYGLGTVFFILALFVMINIFRTHRRQGSPGGRQKLVQIIVLSLLFIFNITRSISLFADAYHSRKILPRALLQLMWGFGHPCLITAYTLIFVILKNALLLKQKFQNWYTAKNIALVTVPYFLFVLAGELTFGFAPRLKGLAFACQLLYVTFGFLLSLFYSFIAALLWWKLGNLNTTTKQPGAGDRGRRTKSIFRICLATAGGGFVLCCAEFYGMVGVYGVFSDANYVDPWPWFAFNTVLRFLEIYLSIILYLITMQNSASKTQRIEVAPITLTSGQGKIAKEGKQERHSKLTTVSTENS